MSKYKWTFAKQGGDNRGDHSEDVSIKLFRDYTNRCLIREFAQNSIDAPSNAPDAEPVEIHLSYMQLDDDVKEQMVDSLYERMVACKSYDFAYQTAVLVTERKSPRGERMVKEAIANGFLLENGQKPSEKQPNLTENDEGKSQKRSNLTISEENGSQKGSNLTISDFPTMLTWNVYGAIKINRKANYSWLADNLGVSEATIKRAISDLKELGYINKEHSKVKGEWQLLK